MNAKFDLSLNLGNQAEVYVALNLDRALQPAF